MSSLDVASYPSNAAHLVAEVAAPDIQVVARERSDNPRSMILREVAEALRTAGNGVTDIETVVAMTQVSARRIADEFGSMNGLVIALAEQLSASMLEPLDRRPAETSFETQLFEFANRIADAYSFSHLRGLYRIALTDAVRNIGTGRTFYERGPGLLMAELARFIHRAQKAGVIRGADCHELASHFMALMRAGLDLSDIFPSDTSNRPPRKEGDVSRIVSLFYTGIRTGESHVPAAL